jgi:hypothetical protein
MNEYIYNYSQRLQSGIQKLKKEGFPNEDKKLMLDFINHLILSYQLVDPEGR